MYRVDVRNIGGTQQSECSVPGSRYAVPERPALSQRISHAHQYSALYLAGHRQRIHDLASVKGRINICDPPISIKYCDIGRVAISDMTLRMRLI